MRPSRRRRIPLAPYLFVAPFGILFVIFFILPIVYGLVESLFHVRHSGLLGDGESIREFVGLGNFATALGDPHFMASIGRVLLFGVVQVPFTIVMALILALLLDAASARFVGFFRSAYFLPYGVPGVIASILWAFLYVPGLSPIVDVFQLVGLPSDFLSRDSVLWAIANIVVWHLTGYNVLVITAQLKSIPGELFEAARIDGASAWQVAIRLKIPLVTPALVLTTVFAVIGTLQLFAEPLILRPITGNVTSTFTPNLTAYNEAFVSNDYNLAAAEAVLLAALTFALSFGFLTLVRRRGRA